MRVLVYREVGKIKGGIMRLKLRRKIEKKRGGGGRRGGEGQLIRRSRFDREREREIQVRSQVFIFH